MDNIVGYFGLKDEDDYMYKRGEAKAETRLLKLLEQNKRFTVIGMLDIAHLTDAQIMTITGVLTEILHQIKKDLAAAPKKINRLKSKLSAAQIAEQLNLPVNWVEKQL